MRSQVKSLIVSKAETLFGSELNSNLDTKFQKLMQLWMFWVCGVCNECGFHGKKKKVKTLSFSFT